MEIYVELYECIFELDRFEGEWRDGKKNGQGVMYFNNGDSYEGEWKDGHKNGRGIYRFSNGDIYEGYLD